MNVRSLAGHPVILAAALLCALSAMWTVIGAPISLITQIAIYTLYGMGVNLLVGYTGLVPFGASVFFGCASYAAAFFFKAGLGSELRVVAASIAFSTLLGLMIGAIILRRRGLYFSLLTLAFSQIAFELAFKWTEVTGGENGMQGIRRTAFVSENSYHAFVCIVVLTGVWFLWHLAHTPVGRALQAVRDNEQRAQAVGYNVFRMRLGAMVLMAAAVGCGGALLTFQLQGVYADNLSWQHSGDSLLMAVLGGVHHFLGPLWGAMAFILLQDRLSALTENWWLIFAPIIMLFALLSPEGLHGLAQQIFRYKNRTLTREDVPPRPARIRPYDSRAPKMERANPVLSVHRLSKQFGSLVTAAEVNLEVHPFVLHSLIGPNGAGKTTFFNMLAGVTQPNGGSIYFEGANITRLPVHVRARRGISRSFQILSIFEHLTVFENVRVAVQAPAVGLLSLFFDAYRLADVNERTWSILDAVGLADKAAEESAKLPHGAKRLLEIAMTLAVESKVLLLDEPLAGLAEADRVVVADLIKRLSATHAVLLIEHDIDRVLAMSDRISVLHQGRIIADGDPADVAADPAVVSAYLGAPRESQRQATPTAIVRPTSAQSSLLMQATGIEAGYNGSTVLNGVSLTIHEGEAVALLGRNGVGKTTLLSALTGRLELSAGKVVFLGQRVDRKPTYEINRLGIALVPEGRRLFPNLSILENLQLAARPGGITIDDAFDLFPRLRARHKASAETISGGERQMVAIARSLIVPSKLILLDEPFEGLAPAVVSEVVDALMKLRGRVAMIIVGHHAESVLPIVDRAYVLVNGVVAFEGDAGAFEADHDRQHRLLGVVGAA